MNLNECVNYILEVLHQMPQLTEQKRHFLAMLSEIRQRASNAYLNVALVGDFSTGKSTFINALLKKDILKTAWAATTAVPTLIYNHDREDMLILVESTDGRKYQLDNGEQRRQLEGKLQATLPSDGKELLAVLSTSNEFARQIKRISLCVPSMEGLQRICIIDTPGVNPGAEEAKEHVMKTREVLQKYADATIVLFQAMQVYSGSFKRFLEENARHFMNDAVFIITMMDVIAKGERDGLVEYVRQQLRQDFGLASPRVYGCCAKAVVSKMADSEGRYWVASFDAMREELIAYMAARRRQLVYQELVGLLEKLVGEMDAEVASQLLAIQQLDEKYAKIYNVKSREYLFERERLEVQRKRNERMHRGLQNYLDELTRERSMAAWDYQRK